MIPTPERIKIKFQNSELLQFAEILHFLITKQREYELSEPGQIYDRIVESGQIDVCKQLYNKIRLKIEDFETYTKPKRTVTLKRREYSCFYGLIMVETYEFNLNYQMLINKITKIISQK